MIERPLMTPDELKSLPKGTFVVTKTGFYPMKVRLKLFFKWGIEFGETYQMEERGNREVRYASKDALIASIIESRRKEKQEDAADKEADEAAPAEHLPADARPVEALPEDGFPAEALTEGDAYYMPPREEDYIHPTPVPLHPEGSHRPAGRFPDPHTIRMPGRKEDHDE